MTTVRQLIDFLFKVEDLDQPVLYQYYIKDHFEGEIPDEVWEKVVARLDYVVPDDSEAYEAICSEIKNQMASR